MKTNVLEWIGIAVLVVVMVTLYGLAVAWPFKWIWNFAVVAALSSAREITFWQAFWLAWFVGLFIRSSSGSGDKK